MDDKPRIMVIKLKELICTAIFVILAILLIFLLVNAVFFKDNETSTPTETPTASYTPGSYTSSFSIGSIPMEVCVKVDSTRIVDISVYPVCNSIQTSASYPFTLASIDKLEQNIIDSQSIDNTYQSSESPYSYSVLIDSIRTAISKATPYETD